MRNNLVKIIFFAFAYLAITTLLYFYFLTDKKNRTNVYLSQQIDKLKSEFKATKNTYEKLSSFVYDELRSDTNFLNLLKNGDKDRLYKYLLPYYQLLKKYQIHYLSIDLANGKTLINMHKPTISSPKKRSNIFSTTQDNNDIVIEFSRPIYSDHTLLGVFRSAISYNVFKNELKRLFSGYYEYILKSDLINKNVFRYGNYLFIQSDLHPQYYYEENAIKNQTTKAKNLIHAINTKIKPILKNRLGKNANFALVTKIGDDYYTISFLAISYKHRHIGYLISYKKDNTLALFDTIFIQNLLFGSILVLILLAFIYYFLHVRYKFESMAVTDKLTGIYNRHKFYEVAQVEVDRSRRNGKPFSIIIFDIDHFKKINDHYGHDVGDYVLAAIAKLVSKNIRKYDFFFRWGGEEFVILSPETDAEGAFKLAEKIRKLVESFPFEKVGKVTISLGLSQFYPESDKGVEDVIKRADNALYQSKREGRNKTNIAL